MDEFVQAKARRKTETKPGLLIAVESLIPSNQLVDASYFGELYGRILHAVLAESSLNKFSTDTSSFILRLPKSMSHSTMTVGGSQQRRPVRNVVR